MNLRRLIFGLYLTFFVGLGVVGGLFFLDAREEFNRLRQIETVNRRRVAEAEARVKEQERILDRLRHDPAYVEKVIRRKLGYARPEQFIFRFED